MRWRCRAVAIGVDGVRVEHEPLLIEGRHQEGLALTAGSDGGLTHENPQVAQRAPARKPPRVTTSVAPTPRLPNAPARMTIFSP